MANTLKLSDVLSKAELRALQQKSTIKGMITLGWNWALIAAAFALAVIWPNPITILLGILILGGRQLGLGVTLHDCAHNAVFKTARGNHIAGHWLSGAPVNAPLQDYREYHLKHHKFAGTPDDPDIGFVKNYPVPKESLKRKFIRDFTGQTGVRDLVYKLRSFKLTKQYPWVLFHILLMGGAVLIGAPWAYLMWWAAEIFVYPAIARLRQIGEHGTAADRTSLDPRLNTGTTLAPWWQRLFISPNNVNYHAEHHMFASIPPYNLKRTHQLLSSRGYYDGYRCISAGFGEVLRRAVTTQPAAVS